jgi:threonine dehydrogenase-like Zn-dependent dehydrogenase
MMQAFDDVAHGGKLIFVGLFQGDVTFHDPDFHRRELTLLASRNATDEDFAHVIAMLEAGKIDLAPWITHRAAPERIMAEFPHWLEPENGVVKAMLEFD